MPPAVSWVRRQVPVPSFLTIQMSEVGSSIENSRANSEKRRSGEGSGSERVPWVTAGTLAASSSDPATSLMME